MRIYNDNPQGKRVDDCTVRAIAVATGESWEYTYIILYEATIEKLNNI